jgi:signal transduction histidine kinase
VRRYAFDVLVLLAAAESVLELVLRQDAATAPHTTVWLTAPVAALIVLPLLARHRHPFAAPATVWLVAAAVSLADGRVVPFSAGIDAAGLAAAFLLGQVPDVVQRRAGLAIVLGSAAIVAVNDPAHSSAELFSLPVVFGLAWLAGFALRERAAEAEAAEERAAQAARLAAAEERTRIARELHDIVAHAVSVMVLQAGAVRHRLHDGDDAEALRDVEATGRTALAEMRRLLGAMRRDDEDAELGPQPGLATLDPLLDAFGRAGLPVRLQVDGDSAPLPRGIDLSAYRIIQEGLTNALKHAHASHADVRVRYEPDELLIDVRDDGHGPSPSDGLGHGLVGVRERVKLYGGEMSAGALSDGGFALTTRLPLEGGR